jgi:hypothetical protein
LARGHKMLNIHSWTKDQLHSSEVHSIEEASCWQEDYEMLNIHLGPKISCIVVRCIVLRRPVVGKRTH